jgi:hypothetical protein
VFALDRFFDIHASPRTARIRRGSWLTRRHSWSRILLLNGPARNDPGRARGRSGRIGPCRHVSQACSWPTGLAARWDTRHGIDPPARSSVELWSQRTHTPGLAEVSPPPFPGVRNLLNQTGAHSAEVRVGKRAAGILVLEQPLTQVMATND